MVRIVPVPALSDNYAYLVIDEATREAAVVDPSESGPVLARAEKERVKLVAVWCTHHHFDHVGGIDSLPALPVLGSAYDLEQKRIPRQTQGLADEERFRFGGHEVRVLAIPGHTLGAIAFLVEGALFSGDTLFLGGCGRVFEGTMPMMQASLGKLRTLDPDTRVYCGHEYTVKNLQFAATVEPESEAIAGRLREAEAMRARGAATVPGTIREELVTNPFFRWDVPIVSVAARRLANRRDADPFTALREAKDRY